MSHVSWNPKVHYPTARTTQCTFWSTTPQPEQPSAHSGLLPHSQNNPVHILVHYATARTTQCTFWSTTPQPEQPSAQCNASGNLKSDSKPRPSTLTQNHKYCPIRIKSTVPVPVQIRLTYRQHRASWPLANVQS